MRARIYAGLAQMISSLANPCDQYCSNRQEVYATNTLLHGIWCLVVVIRLSVDGSRECVPFQHVSVARMDFFRIGQTISDNRFRHRERSQFIEYLY